MEGLLLGLNALDAGLGTISIILSLMIWNKFRGSTYGKAFLTFSAGWLLVVLHSYSDVYYLMGLGEEFPIQITATLSTLGVVTLATSFYLIYRDAK